MEKQELATSDLNEAFDSHFHFDRTCSKIWKHYLLSTGKTAENLLSYTYQSTRQPKLIVSIVGDVKNYSEPSTHPELIQPNGFWGIALDVDVASIVASKLRIPVQHLLKSTVQNSRQLYGC